MEIQNTNYVTLFSIIDYNNNVFFKIKCFNKDYY